MREILELLNSLDFVAGYRIEEYKEFKEGFYIKIIVNVSDKSKLFIIEYNDVKERNYSYHWQDEKNNLIIRWDNSHFHKNVHTFPHHKHVNNQIESSYEITIKDVLCYIEKIVTDN